MDSPATIDQVNSDIKEYDGKLVRSSNILIGYILNDKLAHYWYNYITRDVISDVTGENFNHLIQIQVTMNKRGQGGEGIYPRHNTYDNIHWLHIN